MLFEMEVYTGRDDDVVEKVRKSKNTIEKDGVVKEKLVPIPRPLPSFPVRLA